MDQFVFATSIILAPFATWRISHILVHEEGPFDFAIKFRHLIGIRYNDMSEQYGTNMLARAFSCVWCLSVWVGFALTVLLLLLRDASAIIVYPFAFSALAIMANHCLEGTNDGAS